MAPRRSSARSYIYAGGSDGTAPKADVYFTRGVGSGNLDVWKAAPPLPEARASAASVVIGNTMYLIGGYGPDGKPTDTVYSMTLGQRRHVRRVDDRDGRPAAGGAGRRCRRPRCRTAS